VQGGVKPIITKKKPANGSGGESNRMEENSFYHTHRGGGRVSG